MHFLKSSSHISWVNNWCNAHLECICTRVHVSTIYLESRHMTFFHACDLVLSTGPLKLPGCLSSAWPLKRRLRLRLRRWGFFSLSSVIAKFTMNYSDKNKRQNKKTSFLQRFKNGERELFNSTRKIKQHTLLRQENNFVVLSISNRLKMELSFGN